MTRINGIDMKIYDLDTPDSILLRISTLLNTFPKYLIFPDDKIPEKFIGDIKVQDFFKVVKNDTGNLVVSDFLMKNKDIIPKKIDEKDICLKWLIYNSDLENQSKNESKNDDESEIKSIFEYIIADDFVDKYFSSSDSVYDYWLDRKNHKKNIEAELELNKINNKNYIELFESFEKINNNVVDYTEIYPEKISFSFLLDIKNVTILELFNKIILNNNVPFACCKKYFKILKDFLPSEEWSEMLENEIIIRINKKKINENKQENYIETKITVEGEIGNEIVTVFMNITTEKGNLTQEEYIQRFLTIFLDDISYSNITESYITGVFYFPNKLINTYVFSDLVMNNTSFSSLMVIDESSKTSKKKTEDSYCNLYIHFEHPSTGHIITSLIQKEVDSSDPLIKHLDKNIFLHGSSYIRLRFKAKDRKNVFIFQNMLSKLFIFYEKEYKNIVKIYEKYIPDFGKIKKIKVEKIKKQDNEIFVNNYSRSCTKGREPTMISDLEVKTYEDAGKKVMKFPREKDVDDKNYKSDGLNIKNYICKNPDFPFPGLQKNKLTNSDMYPYLPCCYKNDQSEKAGSDYRNYFFGDELKNKEKKQQDLIITNKILGREIYGTLPPKLQNFFETMDPDIYELCDKEKEYKYVRSGVERNKNSFLNCIMTCKNKDNFITKSEKERDEIFLKIRKDFCSEKNISLSKQCFFDFSNEKISELLMDNTKYIDPKYFIQLAEEYFDCNIFLFDNESLKLPKYTQGYYKFQKENRKNIFLYENWGSESDHADYPQYENIIKWNKKSESEIDFMFNSTSQISKNVQKIFNMLTRTFILNFELTDKIFPSKLNIKSQYIDSYGKCRKIEVLYGDEIYTFITSPLPPFRCLTKRIDIVKSKSKKVIKMLKELNIEEFTQTVVDKKCKEINFLIGNIDMSIPIDNENILNDVDIVDRKNVTYPEDKKSYLDIYNQNKKNARYITEYVFWFFSNYLYKNHINEITDKVINDFSNSSLKIKKNTMYENINKNFSKQNSFIENDKILLQSEEMLKRLLYVLKIFSLRDINSLSNYYKRTSITNYYEDITDFDQVHGQIILYGDDSLEKWNQETKLSYTIKERAFIGNKYPYFYRNIKISKELFLVQNAISLEKAKEICITWKNEDYNCGINSEKINENCETQLYLQLKNGEIEKVKTGQESKHKINILCYESQGNIFYSSLLSLK